MDNETKRKFDAAMAAYLQSGDETAYATLVQMFEDKEQEILALHRKLAAETLRANQGWTRYEEANRDRNSLRQQAADGPDNCEICDGKKGGVRGNENIIDGKTVCDYCHADGSYKS